MHFGRLMIYWRLERKAYPSDVTDDEWVSVSPYLTLMTEYARLPDTLAGLHCLVFAILLLKRFVELMMQSA
jgi:hypothetical protein